MAKPRLLMLDEPSLGLSPILSNKAIHTCEEIRKSGTTILIVEQKVTEVLKILDKGYVLQRGRITLDLGTSPKILCRHKTQIRAVRKNV